MDMRTATVRDVTIGGRQCSEFTLLLNSDGSAVMPVLHYLLHAFRTGHAEASIRLYATHLRDFCIQLSVSNRTFSDVTDSFLAAYRELIEGRASVPYAAQVLGTTIRFLAFLEHRGSIEGVVGETDGHRIRVRRTANGGIKHKLMRGSASPKSEHVPSDREIQILKKYGPVRPQLRERFALMMDWANVRGLRAKEVCGLKISQLPDRDSINRALEENRWLEVELTITKGNKPRRVKVPPLLLDRTSRWIVTDRKYLVRGAIERARRNGTSPPSSCAEIFLSVSGTSPLHRRSLSNEVRGAFMKAVAAKELTLADRVWPHGLRKAMMNRDIRSERITPDDRAANSLRHQTGHASLSSLGRYVVISHGAEN